MVYATFAEETKLWNQGFNLVCGIDEVGRGCFAGPLMAGAVIYPPRFTTDAKIADSKLLSANNRQKLAEYIKTHSLAHGIGIVSVAEINRLGITEATQLAYQRAIQDLKADFYLIDAFPLKNIPSSNQLSIIKGDTISISIASGAIIAKVARDEYMVSISKDYPQYGFDSHVGYGTLQHRQAIYKHGLTPLHRTCFNLAKFCA